MSITQIIKALLSLPLCFTCSKKEDGQQQGNVEYNADCPTFLETHTHWYWTLAYAKTTLSPLPHTLQKAKHKTAMKTTLTTVHINWIPLEMTGYHQLHHKSSTCTLTIVHTIDMCTSTGSGIVIKSGHNL